MSLTVNQFVRVFAGSFVLISLALGVEGSPLFVSGKFLWFTAFVGATCYRAASPGFARWKACCASSVSRMARVATDA